MFDVKVSTRDNLGGKLAAIVAALMMTFGLTLLAWSAAQESDAEPLTVPSLQIMAAESAELGTYLTDGTGRTIYIFLLDTYGVSNCDTACLASWPPVVVDAGTDLSLLGGALDTALLTTIDLADGTEQLVYNGWPLYYYVNDVGADSTFGHGVGEVWYALTPDGAGAGIPAGELGSGAAPQ